MLPLFNVRWSGTERTTAFPGLVSITWLPTCLVMCQPARPKARLAWIPELVGSRDDYTLTSAATATSTVSMVSGKWSRFRSRKISPPSQLLRRVVDCCQRGSLQPLQPLVRLPDP